MNENPVTLPVFRKVRLTHQRREHRENQPQVSVFRKARLIQQHRGYQETQPQVSVFRKVRLIRQHRRHQETQPQLPVPPAQTTLPAQVIRSANLDSATREALRRERQADIDYQLRELLREMRELNRDHKVDANGPVIREATSAQTQLEVETRRQVEAMRAQAEHLRMQQNSDWAHGLSDDPPPGYTPQTLSIGRHNI